MADRLADLSATAVGCRLSVGVNTELRSWSTARRAVGLTVYVSLSHKRRASIGADLALEIIVYAAEFPVSAA
jgi:hypothetical protein